MSYSARGVGSSYFVNNPKWKPDEKIRLTYCTVWSGHGFPEFIEVLPDLLNSFPNLEVLIAGSDRIACRSVKPNEGSFGKWANVKLKS